MLSREKTRQEFCSKQECDVTMTKAYENYYITSCRHSEQLNLDALKAAIEREAYGVLEAKNDKRYAALIHLCDNKSRVVTICNYPILHPLQLRLGENAVKNILKHVSNKNYRTAYKLMKLLMSKECPIVAKMHELQQETTNTEEGSRVILK